MIFGFCRFVNERCSAADVALRVGVGAAVPRRVGLFELRIKLCFAQIGKRIIRVRRRVTHFFAPFAAFASLCSFPVDKV